MKIDASRYSLFWSNPERYRLREIWKLAPIEPKAGTFASLLTYGRRRGTCFHELLDADYRGVDPSHAVADLMDGGFGEKEINAAKCMYGAVKAKYPDEKYLAHEALFTYDIPNSPHKLVGRIDHILSWDGETIVGDWKTTKPRTKKDMQAKAEDYCRSPQVAFYLLGARTLGFDARRFLYRLVVDDPDGVEISEHFTERTGLELKAFAEGVHQTCELILWMKRTFGVNRPWVQLAERFAGDYAPIMGRQMFEEYMPEGFEPKREHLSLMEDEADAVQA